MTRIDKSKRTFFKKVTAAVGFISVVGYLRNLISTRSNSVQAINNNCANDVSKQKDVWLQKQWVVMTDSDKKKMLDEILDVNNKYQA